MNTASEMYLWFTTTQTKQLCIIACVHSQFLKCPCMIIFQSHTQYALPIEMNDVVAGCMWARLTRPPACCWRGIPAGSCNWTCTADPAGSWWWWGDRECRYTLICFQSAPGTGSRKRSGLELWRPAESSISVGNTPPDRLTDRHYLTVDALHRGWSPSHRAH